MKRFYREIRIYIILFATIVMLSACSKLIKGQGYLVTAPGGYSQVFRDLDATAAADLSEQAFLKADKMASPITIAQYFPAKNVVMAIYGNDGFLRTWNIEESKVLSEFDLGITGDIYAGFGDNGNLIMGAMRSIVQENDYGELAERVGGIGIWKSSSGDLLTCIVYPCERTAPLEEWQRHLISGAAFDPDGRWVISNYDTLISITDITDHEIPYSISFSDTDVNHREIALATIDSFNDRFAVAFIDGEILIQSLGKKNLSFLSPKIRLGGGQTNSRHKVLALVFSADGQWLAGLQDDVLSVWKLATRSGDLQFESSINDGKLLAFDRSSELLFVARNDKIDIWNIRKKQLIREIKATEISSLSVSSDNRLLIWGDELGEIHILGVRK